MSEEKLLPLRMVQSSRDFLHKENRRGGSEPRSFIDESEYESHQNELIEEIQEVEVVLKNNFNKYPESPQVIKAHLRHNAIAKTHRPRSVFSMDTCPIIGLENIGELLISATEFGLAKLKGRIKEPTNIYQRANITAIKSISEFKKGDKRGGIHLQDLVKKSTRGGKTYLKVMLFDHHELSMNDQTRKNFLKFIESEELEARNIFNISGLNIWKVIGADENQIDLICDHPSVRIVSFFPTFKIIIPKEVLVKQKFKDKPRPNEDEEYPKIGIIDSGIGEKHPILSDWVIHRKSYIPPQYSNNKHGSFVGGLAIMGHCINGSDICNNNDFIQIADVQAIPNQDSEYGETDSIEEDVLIERLLDSIPEMSKKFGIKIWNISAGFDVPVEDERFSSLAVVLDELQDECNIIITIPSGNYEELNQRSWPPQDNIGNLDRLQVPGDSVRAITVGAIACKESPGSIVKINQPASYSCRGPGPVFIQKPEMVHYSGNLKLHENGHFDKTGQGILSFDDAGNIVEDIGTSFSTPLVARTLSLIEYRMVPSPSNLMIKALALHYCKKPDGLGDRNDLSHYIGFGKPSSVSDILTCKESEITLLFEHEIHQGHLLEYPFAWPESLTNSKSECRGDVSITLVAGVPLNASYGSEYIRANIDVSLQSMKKNDDGDTIRSYHLQGEITPENINNLYEREIIRNGYKWKPIKSYKKSFSRIKAEDWRLVVRCLLRDGVILGETPIKFALVFSLSDPKGIAPVYNEVVMGLRSKNMITTPIQLRSRIKTRIQS